jgi:hypothetical protein
MKQTRKKFYNRWGMIAFVVLLICLTVFFFLKDKTVVSEEKAYLENHTDSLFVSTYTTDSLAVAQSSQIISHTTIDTFASDKKIDPPELPVEKSKPAVRQEERKQSEDDQDDMFIQSEEDNDYTLSNSETQAIFSQYEQEAIVPQKTTNNLNPTPKPTIGVKAYNDYIEKNRKQLVDDDCKNQHGKVILLFRVNEQGHPVDIAVLRSLCQAADREAVRLLQNGPEWTTSNNVTRLEIAF